MAGYFILLLSMYWTKVLSTAVGPSAVNFLESPVFIRMNILIFLLLFGFSRGMDPMIFSGLCGVASAGVGFVAGSAIFKSVWRVWNKEIAQKLHEVWPVCLSLSRVQRKSVFHFAIRASCS